MKILLMDLMRWASNRTQNSSSIMFQDWYEKTNMENDRDETVVLYDSVTAIPAVQAIMSLIYFFIFMLGVCGNVLVCHVVLRNKNMQTVTNFFIANLAMSDILLCIFAVPLTPLYTFIGRWIFGAALCHILPFAQGVSIYISTLTLTSIAVDRYIVIIYPFKPRMKVSTCIVIIFCIWIVACIFTSPYGIYMTVYKISTNFYCEEDWPEITVRHIFAFSTTILQFVLPFAIMAFCYLKVSLNLSERARLKPGAKSSRQEDVDRERKKRTNSMLIAMVAIFGGSWLPLNLFNLVGDLHEPTNHWEYKNITFLLTHVIAMSSTCYNPFLYAWLNENFRKEFKTVLPFNRNRPVAGRHPLANCNGTPTAQELLVTNNSFREKNLTARYVVDEDKVQLSTSVKPEFEEIN